MRFVVCGAGAVGGVVAGLLHAAGHDTVAVARGAHLEAIRRDGLTVADHQGRRTFDVPAVASPAEAGLTGQDVVLLAVKGQDTVGLLDAIRAAAPAEVAIVCLQNGVANERAALRRFADVYGVPVWLPSTHLEPGVVAAHAAPLLGMLDIGRWPAGVDGRAGEISAALRSAGFASEPVEDVARWKHRKLVTNLTNAVGALCGNDHRFAPVGELAQEEGERVLAAAGIAVASREEERGRRAGRMRIVDADGVAHQGDSTWQSLARGTGTVETDYLNGEVVLLGRLHGEPAPVNALLQRRMLDHVRRGLPPASVDAEALLAEARRAER